LLDIRLLGTPQVTIDGEPLSVDTRKAVGLLAYLAIEGQTTRDSAAALFWAESSSERARATLRRTLSSLKAGVDNDSITADRNSIHLGNATVDTQLFDAAIAQTEAHDHPSEDVCSSCIPHLVLATDLYRGDFLEGFSVRDAPEFEDWVRNVSESFRHNASRAFDRLAVARAASGDFVAAIATVRRWIDLDQLHEPAHRQLMLLHAWAGDRPGSIDAYREFVAVLDRELGVPPLEETTELFEAILDEDLPPAPGVRRTTKTSDVVPTQRHTTLVNRTSELDRLRSLLRESKAGGQMVTLLGAPWMGKTRLIEEIASEAVPLGYQVWIGRSFRMEQQLPFGVASQILRAAESKIVQHKAEFPPWAIDEISHLIPALGSSDHTPSSDRFGELRLLEAAHIVVSVVSRMVPLVIIVDDLQWADASSVSLVSYLAKRLADSRVLVLATTREGEVLLPEAAELATQGATIRLGPLTVEDLANLVSLDQASDIIDRTGGVPLLIAEALNNEEGPASDSVELYMESRLKDLGDLSRQVLSTAAVLTGACTTHLLRDASGRSEEEIVDAIEELTRKGLLRELPGTDEIGFTLDRLEKMSYESISLARRRLLHRRAGEALAETSRARTDVRTAASAAAQFRGAGDQRAATWYTEAGKLSQDLYANAEARTFYQTALALDPSDPGLIHLALGELAIADGNYSGSLTELNAAVALTSNSDRALVEHRLGDVHRLTGRLELADEHYSRAESEHPRLADLYADWALLHYRRGRTGDAEQMADRAMEAALAQESSATTSRAHNIAGLVSSDPSSAMRHIDEALDLAGADEIATMAALNNKAHLLNAIGNREAALRLVNEAILLATKTGHRHREAALHNHLADLLYREGLQEESEQAQLTAMSRFSEIGTDDWQPEVWLLSRW